MNIDNLIDNFECPLVNAIFFPNGDMLVLKNSNFNIDVLCESTIDSFFKYNSHDSVSRFDILNKFASNDYIVSVGEGSFGGDGFVRLDDNNGNLIWFLFLDNSNPFINAEVKNDCIEVVSTSDVKIRIPINKPENICIVNQ